MDSKRKSAAFGHFGSIGICTFGLIALSLSAFDIAQAASLRKDVLQPNAEFGRSMDRSKEIKTKKSVLDSLLR